MFKKNTIYKFTYTNLSSTSKTYDRLVYIKTKTIGNFINKNSRFCYKQPLDQGNGFLISKLIISDIFCE